MNNYVYIIAWLVVMVVLVIVEFLTLGLTCIWFAGGALVAAIAALCGGNIWVQLIVFVIVSLALLLFTRPLAQKYFNKKIEKTNLDLLIGEKCVVKEEINNLAATGMVLLKGQEWMARSVQEDVRISVDSIVTVEEISGVKVLVKPLPVGAKEETSSKE